MATTSNRPGTLIGSLLSVACAVMFVGGSQVLEAARQSGGSLVKITPLGSHAGELCRNDRALLLEDPTGVRILYDPGRTVDELDTRLGDVHVMLLSHAHTDHIGDTRPNRAAPGSCAAPATGAANPSSNFASIAAVKNAAVFVGGELTDFLGTKIQGIRGSATPGCAASGLDNQTDVPMGAPCTASLRPGGSRTVRRAGASASVRIAAVLAFHSDGIPRGLIDAPGTPPGTAGYGGSENGFIIEFTNGLVVYLTGDTGLYGDMESIIARFYHPDLLVFNMSDTVTFGPREAVFVTQHLVRTVSSMPSHVNEEATRGGVVVAGTRVDVYSRQAAPYTNVVPSLSDVTRSFDGDGRCIDCR